MLSSSADGAAGHAPRPVWLALILWLAAALLYVTTFGRFGSLHWPPLAPAHGAGKYSGGHTAVGLFQSGVRTARRLAHPALHIETELSDDLGSEAAMSPGRVSDDERNSPASPGAFDRLRRRRAETNAIIRRRLDTTATSDLEASLKVNTCSWNVDQRPPPAYSIDLLCWLLGRKLAERVWAHQEQQQKAHPASPSPILSPSASLTTPDGIAATERRQHRSEAHLARILADFPDLVVVALQEVDMSGLSLVRESTAVSTPWTESIIQALHTASSRQLYYKRLKVVQLVGMLLIVLVRAEHVDYISHVRLSLTRTGAMRVLGNKGSVAMRVTIHGKRFLFITAHFAAHKHNERRRMYNYHAALHDLRFDLPAFTDDESEVLKTCIDANASASGLIDSFEKGRSAWDRLFRVFERQKTTQAEARVLDEHDYIFFLGDLNSRLHALTSDDIRERVAKGEYDYLLCHDELRQGMVYGDFFDGFEEQWIDFAPTYKFDCGTSTYDTSRKHRDPAWCDRVLFRVLDPSQQTVTPATARPIAALEGLSGPIGFPHEDSSSDHSSGEARALTMSCSPPRFVVPTSQEEFPESEQPWVRLRDLTDLGKEVAPPDRTPRSAHSENGSTHSKSIRNTDPPGAQQPPSPASSTSTDNSPRLPATSPDPLGATATSFLASSSNEFAAAESLASPGSLSAVSRTSTNYITVEHPIWTMKRCAETFKAAKNPIDLRTFRPRFPMIANRLNPLEYFCVSELMQSDHRPICARFEAKVISLKPDLVSDLVSVIQEKIAQE